MSIVIGSIQLLTVDALARKLHQLIFNNSFFPFARHAVSTLFGEP
jgi:hypothetical protein